MPFSITNIQNIHACADLVKENCLGKNIEVTSDRHFLGQNIYIGKLAEVQQLSSNPKQPCYSLLIHPVSLIRHINHIGKITDFDEEKIPARVALYYGLNEISVLDSDQPADTAAEVKEPAK